MRRKHTKRTFKKAFENLLLNFQGGSGEISMQKGSYAKLGGRANTSLGDCLRSGHSLRGYFGALYDES